MDELKPVQVLEDVTGFEDSNDLITRLKLSSFKFAADLSRNNFSERATLPRQYKKIIEQRENAVEDEYESYFILLPQHKSDILLTNLLNAS
jgi:hypothetical protein